MLAPIKGATSLFIISSFSHCSLLHYIYILNKKMNRFSLKYFLLTITLLLIEISIALFVHDNFIRPFVGDSLVVILIYCCIKSFFIFSVIPTAVGVLLFSFGIETLQYFQIVHRLHLQDSKLASVIIGTSFSW